MARPKPATHINILSDINREEIISDVLFDSIGEGAIITNERANIARVNQIGQDILGFSAQDLIGKWYPSILIAEDEDGQIIPNIERPITEAFLSGHPVAKRLFYRQKNGERVPVAVNVAPIIWHDRPIGAIQLFRDISDELQLERAKDEFISIASHQLRTPATVVKQNLGLILEGFVTSPKKQADLLKVAYEHNNNQLEIINDLLNVAQAEARKLKPSLQNMDIIPVLKKVIKSQKTEYNERGITLKLIQDVRQLIICGDPLHMQMIFENLVNNAQKYSPSHTEVNVIVSQIGNQAVIKVKDQGYGIAAKDIPQLFRKFSRIENIESTASGTGLGLYWAKKLLDLHGGQISLTSRLGKGTTFKVTLPLGET